MNVIIVSRQGILDTPILVKDDTTAQARFDNLAKELAGEDISEVKLHFDGQVDNLNELIRYQGIEVSWFENVGVNIFYQEED